MPGAHPQVRGVLNLRGRVVPVIDLRRAIGLSDDDNASPPAHLVVAEFNRSVQAFLVSQVERIVHIDVGELRPPPSELADAASANYLTALARFQHQEDRKSHMKGKSVYIRLDLRGRAYIAKKKQIT